MHKDIDDDLENGSQKREIDFIVSSTSWGETEIEDDFRALQKYKEFLESLVNAGTAFAYVLILALCLLVAWIMYSTDFEKIIFYDGSDATCILNSQTGVISNVK